MENNDNNNDNNNINGEYNQEHDEDAALRRALEETLQETRQSRNRETQQSLLTARSIDAQEGPGRYNARHDARQSQLNRPSTLTPEEIQAQRNRALEYREQLRRERELRQQNNQPGGKRKTKKGKKK